VAFGSSRHPAVNLVDLRIRVLIVTQDKPSLRVAQVCPRYFPSIGGVETHVREISKRLLAKGFDVEILATDPSLSCPRSSIEEGLRLQSFPVWAPDQSFFFSGHLMSYLKKHSSEYAIIHAHNLHALPAFYSAFSKASNRLVLTPHYHGTGHTLGRSIAHVLSRPLMISAVRRADLVVCVSNYEADLVRRKLRVSNDKIRVVPNGLDLKEFAGSEKSAKNDGLLLYVGRLEKYKGAQYIIRCLKFLEPEYHLVVVGDGPYKSDLVRLAEREGVTSRVRILAGLSRPELLRLYRSASVFLQLSEREAYGITVAEALASATPCIVRQTSALSEWVDGVNCFGIGDPGLSINLAKLVKIAGESRVTSPRITDWDVVTDKLAEAYVRLD
jgi:glycosyltransferase involved in cell wall biosynthesis